MVTKGTIKNGATTISLTDVKPNVELAVTGETLTFNSQTFTVTSDSFGALPPHVPDVVTITPAVNTGSPTATIASGTTVTVGATPAGVYRSVNDAVFNASTTITSATANFTNADVGSPVTGEIGGHAIGDPPPGNGPTPANPSGAAIPGQNLVIASVTNSTTAVLNAIPSTSTTSANPTPPPTTLTNWTAANAGGGVITIGLTTSAPANLYESLHYAATGCTTGTANFFGDYAPESATMVGITKTTISNSAIGIENAPVDTDFTISYPPVAAGWGDNGGNAAPGVQPTTDLRFNVKNAFVLSGTSGACVATANCDSYTKGVSNWNPTGGTLGTGAAAGDYGTGSKGSLGLTANGLIFCTLAETQGINAGTGPDAALSGLSPLSVCDGGSANPGDHKPSQALGVIINLELNPSASVYGTDNTAPASIWNVVANQAGNAIW
jgi:hypothetical protein